MALQQEARLRQQLNLTPSMQQALKVLQMSNLELNDETKRLLEENIFLEVNESSDDSPLASEVTDSSTEKVTLDKPEGDEAPESMEHVDDSDYYTVNQEPFEPRNHSYEADDDFDIFSTVSESQNLIDFVLEQIPYTFDTETNIAIARAIAYNVNEQGYLEEDLESIHALINKVTPVSFEQVERIQQRFMHLSPVGIGARNPQESLIAQLEEMNQFAPEVQDALLLVRNHLDDLAYDIRGLMKSLNWDKERFDAARATIRQLYAHPADKISKTPTQYIEPDVIVKKANGKWEAFLIRGAHHSLKINDMYVEAVKKMKKAESDPTLQNQLAEAKIFISSLEQRDQTLLATAREVVKAQQEFFDKGPIALKPLTLADIASRVGFHESTISRSTNGKYILTPSGTVELKSFFDRGLSTGSADGVSATELKERIRSLINSEPPTLRLSDQRISKMLNSQGYNVARRTVAKYREAMNIPSSSKRSYSS